MTHKVGRQCRCTFCYRYVINGAIGRRGHGPTFILLSINIIVHGEGKDKEEDNYHVYLNLMFSVDFIHGPH